MVICTNRINWSYYTINVPHIFSPFDQWDIFCNGRISRHRWTGPIWFLLILPPLWLIVYIFLQIPREILHFCPHNDDHFHSMSDRKNNQVPKDLVHKWYEARPTVFYNYLAFTKSPRVQVSQPKNIQWAQNPKILPKNQPIQTYSLSLGIILGYFQFGYPILTLHKIFYDSG